MKIGSRPLLVVFGLMMATISSSPQGFSIVTDDALAKIDSIWYSQNPNSLPIWETLAEKRARQSNSLISIPMPSSVVRAAPKAPVRNVAEFDPSDGVLIRYPLGISTSVIKEMANDLMVYCIVSSSEQSAAQSSLSGAGVNMDNVKFINGNSDSYWTRDYSAWYIIDGDGKPGIVDFTYNRPRPNDDAFTAKQGSYFSIPVYMMEISTAGGDYMCDGMGVGASTDLVNRENSSLQASEVVKRHQDYLGLTKFHVVPDPNTQSTIDHIDCWGKFLAPDKILIRQVPQGNADYTALENAAKYWSSQTSSYGTPYQVFRVTGTASNEAYTNSTILNGKVFVPISGTSNDNPALEVYKKAMPGYKIVGFTGSWQNTDAMHCRTHEMADRQMLYIGHVPLHDTVTSKNGAGYNVDATIKAYSAKSLVPESLRVYYRKKGETGFSSVIMQSQSNDKFRGIIPQLSTSCEIEYYIHAADQAGKSENNPYIGAPDPHLFYGKAEGTQIIAADKKYSSDFLGYTTNGKGNFALTYNVQKLSPNARLAIYSINGKMLSSWNLDKRSATIVWNNVYGSQSLRSGSGVYYCVLYNGKERHITSICISN